MPLKVGFAVLTHDAPQQLLRLVRTLNAMFGNPPIACHHDFGQCRLDEGLFPKNVQFVHPHFATRWGLINVPLGALKAFAFLREHEQPDWIFLLSGSDYPVRTAEEIMTDLSHAKHDAYLDHLEVPSDAPPWDQTTKEKAGERLEWLRYTYYRYCAVRRPTNKSLLTGSFLFRHGEFVPVRRRFMKRLLGTFEFNRPSRIYAGDFWFHGNRKAIGCLLDDASMRKLVSYYRNRENPEESIFQTALCTQADLRICKQHKRYVDWTDCEAHPRWLTASDMPKIAASGAYFARKFKASDSLEFLDETILPGR
jgi:Core-2/I-Branching enzyme